MACKGNTSSAPIVAIQRVTADMLKPFASILAIRAEQAHLPWYASSYHYPCSVWSGAAARLTILTAQEATNLAIQDTSFPYEYF
eukprot:scaffold93496_cov14-Tisochrysis_lutea.AAC.1